MFDIFVNNIMIYYNTLK